MMGIDNADRKEAFLIAFAECGRVAVAADAAGVNPRQTLSWRDQDIQFAKDFDDAERLALRALEEKAYEIALAGDTKMLIFFLERRVRHKFAPKIRLDLDNLSDHELRMIGGLPAD